MPGLTPSQTVGPFFAVLLPLERGAEVVEPDAAGALRLTGTVFDGDGDPVSDALLETWQADPDGRYAPPGSGFTGFGRCATDERGRYEIVTVKPGSVPAVGGRLQAPHIALCVFARGLLKQLVTRAYFSDEPDANAADPVLAAIEDPALRSTLVGSVDDGEIRFDIRLQGERETAFLDV